MTDMINEGRIAFGKRLRSGAAIAKHFKANKGANAVRGLHIRAALRTDCGGALLWRKITVRELGI